jgi:ABC-type sugar transport system ATPase subunit
MSSTGVTAGSGEPLLRLAGLGKTFPGQVALSDVDIEFREGEIHALVGENGSGKSTLIKILSGFHRPDPGSDAWVRGEPTPFPELPTTVPIRTVHQDLGVIGGLSATDNIAFGVGFACARGGRVRWREQRRRTRELISRVTPERVDLDGPMDKAPRLHVTAVAVARVLDGWEGGLLIFDEPTSALPNEEIERLLRILTDLRASGSSIVLISHALDEVLRVADRVTVLRNGRKVGTVGVADLTEHALMTMMLGDRAMATIESAEATHAAEHGSMASRPVALAGRGLCGVELNSVDIDVRAGEVVGVTGLLGSGHLEIAYLLSGASTPEDGTITVGGRTMPAKLMTPSVAKTMGLGFVPADRAREGLIERFSVGDNISLPRLRSFQRRSLLRSRSLAEDARIRVEKAGVRPPNPDARVEVLSGGNKQKVLLARALAYTKSALIVTEPTIGIDIGAKLDVFQQIRTQAENGIGVLVCSTDLTDVTGVCDRVIVLRSGRIVDEFTGEQVNEHTILASITGVGAVREMV